MKRAIVNVAVCSGSSWYLRGQERLSKSLEKEKIDKFFASYEYPTHKSVYEDKIAHIKHAACYYKSILWLDCSITAVKSLKPIWDYIDKNGVYLYESGGNCAETCNDNCLSLYGITRDEAELIPECASNVVGINLDHEKGKKFYDLWIKSLETGANIGIKWPTEEERKKESTDSRFKYHRQDQSTASLAAYLAGVKLEKEVFVVRYENLEALESKNTLLILKGGE